MKDRIRYFRKLFRKTNEKEFTLRRMKLEQIVGHPGSDFRLRSFTLKVAETSIKASSRKRDLKSNVTSIDVTTNGRISSERP
jgi:hypothetical protein